jgi:hypothetical protein
MDNIINLATRNNINTNNTSTSTSTSTNPYDEMLQKIEVHKDTHPNLYRIWFLYISKLKIRHENISRQLDMILDAIPNNPDLSGRNIMILYAYNIASNTN